MAANQDLNMQEVTEADVQVVEDEQEGRVLDEEFRQDDCVEVDFDDDEPPPESDDEQLEGIDEEDDDAMEPEADHARARVSHSEAVLSVAFNPTNQRSLLTGGQDDCAVLWSIDEAADGSLACAERHRLTGHTDSVSQVAFSNDGKFVATGSLDGSIKIWSPETGELVQTLEGPSKEVEWISWHPKGHAILAGSADTMAWMWWAPSGKLMQIFAGHAMSVTCGAWGLGGKLIVTGSEDRTVIVWNPRSAQPVHHVKGVHAEGILCMCAHPEAPLVVSGALNGSATVTHIETGKVVHKLEHKVHGHEQSVEAVAFNNPGTEASALSLVATASMDGRLNIWDGKTFELRSSIKEHAGGIVRFKWLPAPTYGSCVCTCSTDGSVRLFNALGGQCLLTLLGHSRTVLDVDLALGGDAGALQLGIVSGSEDKTCRVYTASLAGHPSSVQAAIVGYTPPEADAVKVEDVLVEEAN